MNQTDTMNRKQHWESVYTDKSPLDVSWYQTEPRLSLELISATGARRDAPILDVGGGASVLVDRLLDAGYTQLSVLDISSRALDHARRRLGPRATQVEWIEADITQFVPPRVYQVWHDRAVFHFLTEEQDRQTYKTILQKTVMSGGFVIMSAFALNGATMCSGLPVQRHSMESLHEFLGDEFKLVESLDYTYHMPSGDLRPYVYARFQKP